MSAEETQPGTAVFLTDVLSAVRALIEQPSIPLISVALACVPVVVQRAGAMTTWRYAATMATCLFQLGWVGSERIFFCRHLEGRVVGAEELVHRVKSFVGRFLVLGLLVFLAMAPIEVLTGIVLGDSSTHPTGVHGVVSACLLVAADFALTFVTPALALTTRSVRRAVRIGAAMIRQTWPRCALYVLFPPLALQLGSLIYPSSLPLLELMAVAAATVAALLAKGATVAFYLRAARAHGGVSADYSIENEST